MTKLLLNKGSLGCILVLLLVFGCSKEPVNLETFLVEKNGVYYTLDTTKPYSGPVFSNYKNINKKLSEGYLRDGKKDGKWIYSYQNGQIKIEGNYKDGELDGKVTYYHEWGLIDRVEEYENGELVK